MNKLPPEILAIPLPEGMQWTVFREDPAVFDSNSYVGWVNPNSSFSIYVSKPERYIEVDITTPVVDLCKILAAHLWIKP